MGTDTDCDSHQDQRSGDGQHSRTGNGGSCRRRRTADGAHRRRLTGDDRHELCLRRNARFPTSALWMPPPAAFIDVMTPLPTDAATLSGTTIRYRVSPEAATVPSGVFDTNCADASPTDSRFPVESTLLVEVLGRRMGFECGNGRRGEGGQRTPQLVELVRRHLLTAGQIGASASCVASVRPATACVVFLV